MATKYQSLSIRILADKSGPTPVDTGKMVFGSRDEAMDPPAYARVASSSIANWRERGIVSTEGGRVVVRSGGPPDNPWKVDPEKGIPHVFEHLDTVTFHTEDGDVTYEVVENPDKWPESKDGDAGHGGEVRWFYDLKLADGG